MPFQNSEHHKNPNIFNIIGKPGKSLKQKTIHGGFWVFSLRIFNRLLQLVRTVILARLLSPSDFGIFGLALLTLSLLDIFSQTGFRQALVQKKEDIRPYLDTAWTVGVIRGLILAAAVYLLAPYVAVFFDAQSARSIIRVIGLVLLVQSLTNIAVVYFEKELEFRKYFSYQFFGTIIDVAVTVGVAFTLRSVWALVFGVLAGNVAKVVFSYVIHPYRPRVHFDVVKTKELFGFGKFIFFHSMVLFLLTQGDDAVVGKIVGMAALGLYQMAYRISNLAATEVTHVVSQVTFPLYSKIQDDKDKLRAALTKTLEFIAMVSFPIAGGLLVLAPEFTALFLGEKWMPMVPAMQVMCLFGAMRSVGAAFGPIFRATAQVHIPLKISLIQLACLAALIYPLIIELGILGAAIAITICVLIPLSLSSKNAQKILSADLSSLVGPIWIPAAATVGMVAAISVFKHLVLPFHDMVGFLILVFVGAICYLGLVYIIYRVKGRDLRNWISMT